MRSRIFYLFFLYALLLAIVACNFPMRLARSVPEFTAENLRQTVEAMPTPETAVEPLEGIAGTPPSSEPFSPPTLDPTPAGPYFEYVTRPGDTMAGLTGRFGFDAGELLLDPPLPEEVFLPIGQQVRVPNKLENLSPARLLLPDSELVYSPAASDFDIEGYVRLAGGYLNEHSETVKDQGVLSGAEIVHKVAAELSVNPRLLLAIIDVRSGWLFDHPPGAENERYPIGFRIPGREGLYEEIRIAATQLNLAYYGWRTGEFTTIEFDDGSALRLHPALNAGSVAIMHLFTYFSGWEGWVDSLYGPESFSFRHHNLFGDAWTRADKASPLLPEDLTQPELALPFYPNTDWSLTAGPHNAWNAGTPLGALDFAPVLIEEPCAVSTAWVTASAPGRVVRARDNVVALDLDGDGDEGTGWVLVYYHIAGQGMVAERSWLEKDQLIGHPSCEGGRATGTHVHVARKYNGEWISADGPVPFVLSGWRVEAGERIYAGRLVKGSQVVTADPSGRAGSTIRR
jgi:LasA protease